MAICKYCGEKAGWFSEAHEACIQKATHGIEALKQCVSDAVVQGKQYPEIKAQLDRLAADSNVPQEQVPSAIKEGWSQGAGRRSIAQPISDPSRDCPCSMGAPTAAVVWCSARL